ncbi:mobilization protein [Acidiphilium sp.]|uniref:mobilization protein n=1 Tax=Acidiphilium sp. TaxID=527 RepID=UPI0025856543|nr:mobilization protein [Acidiphilium sp.]
MWLAALAIGASTVSQDMTSLSNRSILPETRQMEGTAMVRRSIEERLAQLEAQRKTLQARLGKQERARDTRRKILLGALVLHRLETSGDGEFSKRLGDWLRRELPGFLTRDDDKALFADLLKPPTEEPTSAKADA